MASTIKLPRLMAAKEATGDGVVNDAGETLGKIEEFVIDLDTGRIAYALLSFGGGFMGMGNKWFAVPWEALTRSHHDKKFILHVSKEVLERAPGFTGDERPDYDNREWATGVYTHYGYRPYWLKE